MVRYKLIISYDGSNFLGYQTQKGKGRTVQEELEKVIKKVLNKEEIKLEASGRTDKGVHSYYQVCSFANESEIDIYKFKHSLNKLLPNDIYIKEMKKVNINFHPRFDVKYKIYEYLINDKSFDPLRFNYELYLTHFNKDKVNEIIPLFIGKKSFRNFTSKEEDEWNFIREIYEIKIISTKNGYKIRFKGDGFMRYEIRKIVGTFIAYSEGKISLEEIKKYLDSKNKDIVPFQADAKGLYLVKVVY